jgi:hypothetical protein
VGERRRRWSFNQRKKAGMEMKRICIVGLCLTAAFGCGAVAAASASAVGISFKPSKGGFPITYASKGESSTFETVEGMSFTCTSRTDSGEIQTAHLGKTRIALTGCSAIVLGVKKSCKTEGASSGEIVVSSEFHLGLASSGKVPELLLLMPAGGVTVNCAGVIVHLKGEGLVGHLEVSPGKLVSSVMLAIAQSKGKQEFTEFQLMSGGTFMTGIHLTQQIGESTVEETGVSTSDTFEKFENSTGKVEIELEEKEEEASKGLSFKLTRGEFPATFTSKSGELSLETANGSTITCQKKVGTATLEDAHLGKTTTALDECETSILGHKGSCGNEGSKSTITLKEWEFYIGSADPEGRPAIFTALPSGKFSFKCTEVPIIGEMTVSLTGEGLVGLLRTLSGTTPTLNTKYASLNIVYEQGSSAGTQKYTEFLLPASDDELMSGLQLKYENSFEKKSENLAQVLSESIEKLENSKKELTELEIMEG